MTHDGQLDGNTIHQWYRIIMGFDWKLVQFVIERLSIGPNHVVLDPFCGAGTTLVQCKKHGIRSIGIDANPVCVLASQVKTFWNLRSSILENALDDIVNLASEVELSGEISDDVVLGYLQQSGMLDRGWLSRHKARKVVALRLAIEAVSMTRSARKFFRLALISAIVGRIADIKFGPEVYCLKQPRRTKVTASFVSYARTMIRDMDATSQLRRSWGSASVHLGDSRNADFVKIAVPKPVDFVVTSPPYPAEHDYTRSTRLELVTLGHVLGNDDLRQLKRRMVRCHTKGIYKGDVVEAKIANRYPAVREISSELQRRGSSRADGFSRLYGRMVGEYFGGMVRHLRAVNQALRPGGYCAYVVRDQKSFLDVYIDTPALFANIATSRSQGLKFVEAIEWKISRGSTGTKALKEQILIFKKPA